MRPAALNLLTRPALSRQQSSTKFPQHQIENYPQNQEHNPSSETKRRRPVCELLKRVYPGVPKSKYQGIPDGDRENQRRCPETKLNENRFHVLTSLIPQWDASRFNTRIARRRYSALGKALVMIGVNRCILYAWRTRFRKILRIAPSGLVCANQACPDTVNFFLRNTP